MSLRNGFDDSKFGRSSPNKSIAWHIVDVYSNVNVEKRQKMKYYASAKKCKIDVKIMVKSDVTQQVEDRKR